MQNRSQRAHPAQVQKHQFFEGRALQKRALKIKFFKTMQKDRIALDTIIADQDTSMIISGMNARIKMLEDKILDVESRKDYE